jgi:hypothetical protein
MSASPEAPAAAAWRAQLASAAPAAAQAAAACVRVAGAALHAALWLPRTVDVRALVVALLASWLTWKARARAVPQRSTSGADVPARGSSRRTDAGAAPQARAARRAGACTPLLCRALHAARVADAARGRWQARAEFHRDADARFESCEVGGGAWLNTLLRSTWHASLEAKLAELAAENLQEALDKARAPRPRALTVLARDDNSHRRAPRGGAADVTPRAPAARRPVPGRTSRARW